MPAIQSIRNWRKIKFVEPGLSPEISILLQQKFSKMPVNSKKCVLVFDEVSIKKALIYNQSLDKIDGLVDIDGLRKPQIANQSCVFMIRGLVDNWKYPLSYCLAKNGLNSLELKQLILKSISFCQNVLGYYFFL